MSRKKGGCGGGGDGWEEAEVCLYNSGEPI